MSDPVNLHKAKFKQEFMDWVSGKTPDEIAEKVWLSMSVSYDLGKNQTLQLAFKHLVKPNIEKILK